MFRRLILVAAIVLGVAQAAAASDRGLAFFSVGGGELGLGYDTVLRAICGRVNAAHPGRLRCSPETTPGSRYNIDALLSGELGFGVVQADLVHAALETAGDHPLRLVARLFDETFVLLARRDAGIAGLADLVGKRVDIGRPASGRHVSAQTIFAATGVDVAAFAGLFTMTADTAVAELCADRLDAAAFVVGHPSSLVAQALDACDAVAVALTPVQREAIAAVSPAFHGDAIPAALYSALSRDVPTVALAALLLARADQDEAVVRALMRVLIDRRAALAAGTPLLDGFDPTAGLDAETAPTLHPGARQALSGQP